jgi:hypothetical protein
MSDRYFYMNVHLAFSPEAEHCLREANKLFSGSLVRFEDDGPVPHVTLTSTFFTESIFTSMSSLGDVQEFTVNFSGVRIVRNRWIFLDIAKDTAAATALEKCSEILSGYLYPDWGQMMSFHDWEPHVTLGVLPSGASMDQVNEASNLLMSLWKASAMTAGVKGRICFGDVGEFGTVVRQCERVPAHIDPWKLFTAK